MAPRDAGPDRSESDDEGAPQRRRWMAVLAKANAHELESAWARLASQPDYETLRGPETGLVMVRGRIGGTGDAFNLGEMSMTRCAIRLHAGDGGVEAVGFAFVAGRDRRHAELAAVFDALLQGESDRGRLHRDVIEPLAASQAARKARAVQQSAATRVDFFTMVRE
jgi:alpha-D-ribose 1-methylphosphonate 5-triphosphate synthase subunit PhnG